MTLQQLRRERASSDKAQAVPTPVPKRPSLPNRTNSAPVGALYQVNSTSTTTTKVAPGTPSIGQQTVIEENQSPSPTMSSGNPAMPPRVGDEV